MLFCLPGLGHGFLIALLLLPLSIGQSLSGQAKLPMTVDDVLDLEYLGAVAVSPDGDSVAVAIARAASTGDPSRGSIVGSDRSDIWLLPRRGGEPRNLTNGATDGSGYWNPIWSPDGKRLAMLSNQGGDDIHPYVYEVASGRIQRLTDRGIDEWALGDEEFQVFGQLFWSDSTTLLCPVRAEGSSPAHFARPWSLAPAVRAWTAAVAGRTATASVLESGSEVPEAARPKGALLAIDVRSRRSRLLLEGNVRRMLLSPTGRHLAVLVETGRMVPRASRRVGPGPNLRPWELWRTRLAIVPLQGDRSVTWVKDVVDPQPWQASMVHSWSPDGRSLAAVGRFNGDAEYAATVFLVSVATGTAKSVTTSDFEASGTAWSTGGALLAYGRPRQSTTGNGPPRRLDWWLLDRQNGGSRILTAHFSDAPRILLRTMDSSIMLGVADGELWSIDTKDATLRNLTKDFEPRAVSLDWPAGRRLGALAEGHVVVRTNEGELYRLPMTGTEALVPLHQPSAGAELVEVRQQQGFVLFRAMREDGTHLWAGDWEAGHFQSLLIVNQQLAQIADASQMLVPYRGVDGDSLGAVLLLPVGYERGQAYPMVTWVYPGIVLTDTVGSGSNPYWTKNDPASTNFHVLMARGYAVLLPSMPLRPVGVASDPYIDLIKGVMPAVERVIELGIADPKRLGVMGHSFGGYGTYGVITQTSRFKAAVALAGFTNLVSYYGTFYPIRRYENDVHEETFGPALSEGGQVRMGGTPWDNPSRYEWNSPLLHADRVETPVMIIHGDMDYVPIQQAEEFFTALYRLRKPARFVRYWGEGHIITSPANVRDMWQRIFSWFDQYLAPASGLSPRMNATSIASPDTMTTQPQ